MIGTLHLNCCMAVDASPCTGRANDIEREAKNHLTSGLADSIWERAAKHEFRRLWILPNIFVEPVSQFRSGVAAGFLLIFGGFLGAGD